MNSIQPHLENLDETRTQKILASLRGKKASWVVGSTLAVLLFVFLRWSFVSPVSEPPPTFQGELQKIYAERLTSRVRKSDALAKKADAEKSLTEAKAELSAEDSLLIFLLQEEVRLGEERAGLISIDSLEQ